MPTTVATVRFHVELSHFDVLPPDLRLHAGVEQFPLTRHTKATLAHAKATNRAIARMKNPARITHFADVPVIALPARRITQLQVTYDQCNPEFTLRGLALMATRIPANVLRRVRSLRAASVAVGATHSKLRELDIGPAAPNEVLDLLADADLIVTPLETAATTVSYHPQLGSTFPPSAANLMENHIKGSENANALANFANTIRMQGPKWNSSVAVTDPFGNPMTFEFDVPGGPNGGNAIDAGKPIEQYELSQITLYGPPGTGNGYQQAMPTAIRTASNDAKLRNQSWTVAQGTPSSPPVPAKTAALGSGQGTVTWTTTTNTANFGLSLDSSSIAFDDSYNFSVGVTNTYVRALGAYVSIFDENGVVMDLDTYSWVSNLGADLSSLETSTLKYLQIVHPETMIMGIPIKSSSATLGFAWPTDSNGYPIGSSATLYFGSLGGSAYQNPQCVLGGVLTGVFNLGFPAFFLAQGINGGGGFLTSLMAGETSMVVVGVALVVLGGVAGFMSEIGDTMQFLTLFAGLVVGLIFKAALAAIFAALLAYVTGMEILAATPFVGWVLRAAALVGYTEQLAETTSTIFRSPATLVFDLAQTVPISATFSPDPAHGLPGAPSTAVWPALASSYEAALQYQGGTCTTLAGIMPSAWSGTPVTVDFGAMPAGGQFQIVVSVLADNGWLCGTWTSGWLEASPATGESSISVVGNITELLAPLTADTTYEYGQSIVYDSTANAGAGGHVWSDSAPTETVTSLTTQPGAPAIGSLVDISILNVTYDVAYAWSGAPLNPPLFNSRAPAPGQAYMFQSVNVLAEPDLRLMTPSNVTTAPCFVAYEKYGPAPTTVGVAPPYNFYVDVSTNTPTLRLLDLSGAPGTLPVGPPAPAWATFPGFSTIDQLVVHQSGVAIGFHRASSQLAIVQLPLTGVTPDSAAPVAQVCSGLGTRQGLMNTPIAMDIRPDGAILVLEQGNQRVQAFDHFGNPVAAFDGNLLFTVGAGTLIASLNAGSFPAGLQSAFQLNGINMLFSIDASVGSSLAPGVVAQSVIAAFEDESTILSASAVVSASPTGGTDWLMTDPLCVQSYVLSANQGASALNVFASLLGATVTVLSAGSRWIVRNSETATSYDVVLSADTLSLLVYDYLATFPLVQPTGGSPVYLDLAVDPTGYTYVIYYTGTSPAASDYALQIYNPSGSLLAVTPNPALPPSDNPFVGGCIAIDIWRNLFTLDYRLTSGPNGQAEPTISQWMPTPPVAALDPDTYMAAFMSTPPNCALIATGIGPAAGFLPASFAVTTVSPAGHWQIVGPPNFDVILSGGGSATGMLLYVYAS